MAKAAVAAASPQDVSQELSRSIVAILLKEPFYGHLLGGVVRRIDESVPTAAVALTPQGLQLIVNPNFFMHELKRDERVAVIKHEALHLVFRHLYRPLFQNGNQQIFNIAADLVVNQHVAPWPLPENAVTLKLFPDMDLKVNQSLEWYYKKLTDLHRKTQDQKKTPGKPGRQGSSKGQPDSGQSESPQSAEALEKLMGQALQGDHSLWASAGGEGFAQGEPGSSDPVLTESLRKALESDLERHLLRARDQTNAKRWGDMPLGIRSALDEMAEQRKPQVDWRRTLRLFAFSGYRTSITATKRRMSKRFNTFPGIRIQREQRVAVVIDTSGSINAAALELFFGEIHGIWRTGAEVVVIEADAAVQQSYPYKGKPPKGVKGGGGTSFDPALQWLSEPRNGRFDACIYLTDGYASEPKVKTRCPLLWVITPGGRTGEHLKSGRVVCLPEL